MGKGSGEGTFTIMSSRDTNGRSVRSRMLPTSGSAEICVAQHIVFLCSNYAKPPARASHVQLLVHGHNVDAIILCEVRHCSPG